MRGFVAEAFSWSVVQPVLCQSDFFVGGLFERAMLHPMGGNLQVGKKWSRQSYLVPRCQHAAGNEQCLEPIAGLESEQFERAMLAEALQELR
jgi:hypothetical protein